MCTDLLPGKMIILHSVIKYLFCFVQIISSDHEFQIIVNLNCLNKFAFKCEVNTAIENLG